MYETSAPFLWALAAAPDGSLFVGTGNEGKVFRIDPQGKGSLFFDAPELEVHALAPAPNGGLYVATSPDGRIYKVDRDGKDTVFFDPDDKVRIWSLAVDSRGNVFAGTGEKGVVYKITPVGNGAKLYDSKATHATALAFDEAGKACLSGTGMPGRVVRRVDAAGKGFVLLDSPYDEIRALRLGDRGLVYVAALSGRAAGGSSGGSSDGGASPAAGVGPRRLTPSVSVEVTSFAVVDTGSASGRQAAGQSSRENRRNSRGAVYRIAPDGLWDQLWETHDDAPYDLTFAADGAVIVGTGNKGKVYRLEGDPVRPTLVARGAAQQITAFYKVHARGRLSLCHRQSRLRSLFRVSQRPRGPGHVRNPSRGMRRWFPPGARSSWRGSTSGRRADRSFDALRQHRNAGRHVERLVAVLQVLGQLAHRQSQSPVPAVACRPDRQGRGACPHLDHRRLSAAQHPPAGPLHYRPSSRASCSRSRSRPAIRSWPASRIRRHRIASWHPPR